MIRAVEKHFSKESIIYSVVDNENVCKKYFDENENKTKEKNINVKDIKKGRLYYRNTQGFLLDLICNNGYTEIM